MSVNSYRSCCKWLTEMKFSTNGLKRLLDPETCFLLIGSSDRKLSNDSVHPVFFMEMIFEMIGQMTGDLLQ